MGGSGVNSVDAFDRILASLYRATRDGDHWPASAALIEEACGAEGNLLTVSEGSGDDVRVRFFQHLCRGEPRQDVIGYRVGTSGQRRSGGRDVEGGSR